ncbi:hypothetical protein ACQP0C_18020 [Nocardia sp. CA-129566]|uniref:hypothetical protein n=1 Tax=Nocardia sp. CA-129566 TaxID=3239976 RepID=UPI003D98C967
MITPIEIKVDLDGDVADALTRLGCTDRAAIDRRIWFAEPRPAGPDPAPTLLSSRIAIRLRSGENDDITVKLRPCLQSQLVGRWRTPFTNDALRYRIEEDWNSDRRALSASAVSQRPAGSLHDATMLGADVTTVLDTSQRQFLVSCTPPGVAVDRLTAMGPISSTKWTQVRVGDLKVDAERWRIAGLDLLELSLRVTPEHSESHAELRNRAIDRQRRFETAVRRHGLHIGSGETKTQQVLAVLRARSIGR